MRVFVYGTLKNGFRNHYLIANQPFVGDATTAERYRMYTFSGAYPVMVPDSEGYPVTGEVYNADEISIARMDLLEGVNNPTPMYRRETIVLSDGSAAQTYLWNRDLKGSIEVGPTWEVK